MDTPVLVHKDHGGVARLKNLPDAVDPQEPATLAQLDAVTAGLAWKDNVRAATTASVNLRAEDGGAITVVPNDAVVPAEDRITTSDGLLTVVDCKHVQIFTQWDAGARGPEGETRCELHFAINSRCIARPRP